MGTIILFLFFAISLGAAVYFWRLSQDLRRMLKEGAHGYDVLAHRYKSIEVQLKAQESDLNALRSHAGQQAASLIRLRQDNQDMAGEIERARNDFRRKLHDTEAQRDQILAQYSTMSGRAEISEGELQELRARCDAALQDVSTLTKKLSENLDAVKNARIISEQNQKLQLRQAELEREIKIFKQRPDMNPKAFDTLRRKVGHYQMLYTGMKGQREMYEERNKNWEFALEHLARWILTKSSLARDADRQPGSVLDQGIGPLVGEALERIGVEISVDSHQDHGSKETVLTEESQKSHEQLS